MKAAIYNPYWDTLGGGERYTASFVRLLLDKGWNVDIFSNNNMSEDIRRRFGLDIKSANFIPFPKNYQQTTYQYSLVFWLSDGSLPVSFARRTVVHFQFPFKDVGGRTPLSFLKSRFYTFVVNSRFTKTFIDSEYRVKSRVIYPPIHSAGIGSGFKTNTILYVGRFSSLTQSKGHDVLIRSFRNLHYRIPGWKLILAGGTKVGTDKVELSALRDMADRMGVGELTSFVAAVIQSEQLGVSLAKVLRIQSDQMRVRRRQMAEEEAHRAPIKMIFPIALLIFPSILIVLLGPAAMLLMQSALGGILSGR